MTAFDVEEFNLSGLLSALAAENMSRAVQLTDRFSNEAARVSAVVAVAHSVLRKGIYRLGDGRSFPRALHLARSPGRVRAVPFRGRRAVRGEGTTASMN